MCKKITAVAMVAAFAAMTASAGIIVDSITGADNRAYMSPAAGQTFTVGTLGTGNELSSITILGSSGGGGNLAVVSATLWTDTDGDFGTWDPGTLVATSVNSQEITGTDTEFTFNFSNEILSDSTVYILSFNDGTSDHVAFRSALNSGGDSLADGAVFSAGAQPFGGAYDASIRVTTIPEPATLGMVAAFGGAILFIRRKIMI